MAENRGQWPIAGLRFLRRGSEPPPPQLGSLGSAESPPTGSGADELLQSDDTHTDGSKLTSVLLTDGSDEVGAAAGHSADVER